MVDMKDKKFKSLKAARDFLAKKKKTGYHGHIWPEGKSYVVSYSTYKLSWTH